MSQKSEELSRVSGSKSRKKTHYAADFKRAKVCEYFQSGMGIAAFSQKAGIPLTTLNDWVEAFKAAHPTIANSAMTKDEKTRALEEEVAQLKRELVQTTQECQKARACAHAWETMVDVAEKMYGIEIKKSWRQTISRLKSEHTLGLTMPEVCSLFGVTKQAYYKYDEQAFQTKLLRDKIAVDYALRIRTTDPRIGCKKLYLMYAKEFVQAHPLGRDHFLRLLEQRNLKLRRRRSKVPRTTDSRHHYPTYPNCIWSVIPQKANQIWVSDITYMRVWDDVEQGQYHFCYLSLITDAYSKMVVGYAVGDSLDSIHPLAALKMALATLPLDFDCSTLTHHSDRGVQYAGSQYVQALSSRHITISMTENGNPKHNAIAERINNTIKNEFFAQLQFTSLQQVQQEVAKAVAFYNTCRPHWSLAGMTPAEAALQEGEIPKCWYSYRENAIKELAM